MFKRSVVLIATAFALAAVLTAPVRAQSTDAATATTEELQNLFQKQKTRGLSLVASSPSPESLPTVADEAKTNVAPVAYSEIEKEDQINVRITFDFDSSVLNAAEKPKLATLCEAMKTVDVNKFRIVGHTDGTGSDAYNEKLSLLRAEEVKRFMVADCGIDAAKLEAVGVGKRFLFNADDPRADENRRVEFQALS